MPGGKTSQPQNTVVAESKQEPYIATAAAKVTLVKPAQMHEHTEENLAADIPMQPPISLARPKIGRASARDLQEKKEPLVSMAPLAGDGHSLTEGGNTMQSSQVDMATVRPWDFKFALVLVTLFVVVNLALIFLLHSDHTVSKHTPHGDVVAIKHNPVPPVALEDNEATSLPVPPQAPGLPPLPAVPATTTSWVPASAVVPVPQLAPHAPPVASTTFIVAPATPKAVSAVPPEAALSPAAGTAAPSQDLLSIIGKN